MIITLADYHTLTGISDVTNDAFISANLQPVQDLIEAYTDRHFDKNTYQKWITSSFTQDLILDEYPILKVIMIGSQIKIASLSWDEALYDYAVEVKSDRVTVTNTKSYGYSTGDSLFVDNQTMAALKIDLEDDWNLSVAIETGYTDFNTQFLKTGNGQTIYGAKRTECNYRIQDDSLRYIKEEDVLSANFYSDVWFSNSMFVCYEAGYTSATMPKGLQQIMANILKDMVSAKSLGGKTMLKSEQITNYAYQNWSPSEINIQNIIKNYYGDLEFYKKKSI